MLSVEPTPEAEAGESCPLQSLAGNLREAQFPDGKPSPRTPGPRLRQHEQRSVTKPSCGGEGAKLESSGPGGRPGSRLIGEGYILQDCGNVTFWKRRSYADSGQTHSVQGSAAGKDEDVELRAGAGQ